jgi:tetratricopeptide (TPR) repeat protein
MSVLLLSLSLGGCQIVQGFLNNPSQAVEEGQSKLKAGDLAGAAASFEAAVQKAPTNVDAASGAAYMKVLAGDFAAADALLAAAEPTAAERTPEIKLRRALVAVESGDLDKVKELAAASGLPAGQLLAAEVELADGNRDAARTLLESAKADSGEVGATAGQYLEVMGDANPLVAGLAEAQALWALGKRNIAVRSVEDLVKAYAESHEDGGDQLLLWAGRAASVGEASIATNLLDSITVPPAGQGWRVLATRAIITCAQGDGAGCQEQFEALKAGAPADGYADARVSAALAVADKDAGAARALLQGVSGDAAARAWAAIGDSPAGAAVVADAVLKSQLGG